MADLEVEAARSGVPTLKWKGRHLASAYDPVREAERLVEGAVPEGTSVVVLLGLGLGYHAAAAARRGAYVVAVERRPEIAAAARAAGFFAAVESAGRGAAVVGLDGAALREAIRARLDIWTIQRVVTLPVPTPPEDTAYYTEAKRFAREAVENAAEEIRTIEDFARPWLANALANLPRAAAAPPPSAWRGAWRGRPAVLLSAGPSAAEGIETLLARTADRPPVVCVDAALPMALARGLIPDLVVTADPQEKAARHVEAAGAVPDVPLVSLLVGHPRAVGGFARAGFIGAHYPLEGILGWGDADRLDTTGGSVATVAAALLDRMGAGPILLVGQDLALPGGEMYAAGGLAEREAVEGGGRFATTEGRRRRESSERNLRSVPAACGGEVLSIPNLESYRRWFEASAARGMRLVQTSRIGARIEGAEHVPLEEALRRHGGAAPPLPWRPPPRPLEWRPALRRWAADAARIGEALGGGDSPVRHRAAGVYPLVEHIVVDEAFREARAAPERSLEILRAAARRAGAEIAEALRKAAEA